MNRLFNREVRDAVAHGFVAGVLVIVLNGVGLYGFGVAIPFAWGFAVAVGLAVTAIELFVHPHGRTHNGY